MWTKFFHRVTGEQGKPYQIFSKLKTGYLSVTTNYTFSNQKIVVYKVSEIQNSQEISERASPSPLRHSQNLFQTLARTEPSCMKIVHYCSAVY
jgi:hypothetical protein